jgi:hypothetical protein
VYKIARKIANFFFFSRVSYIKFLIRHLLVLTMSEASKRGAPTISYIIIYFFEKYNILVFFSLLKVNKFKIIYLYNLRKVI